MSGFTKLFSTIIGSTVWREDDQTRLVWITMLALADRNGDVCASLPGLADFARVHLDKVRDALQKFQAPDEYSRTPDNDGRRISVIHGGWHILNYELYRVTQSSEEKRLKANLRMARWRAKNKTDVMVKASQSVTEASLQRGNLVTPNVDESDTIAEAEADIYSTSDTSTIAEYIFPVIQTRRSVTKNVTQIPDCISLETWADYLAMRRVIRKPATAQAQKLAITKLLALRDAGEDPQAVLEQSILNSWQGLFPVKENFNGRKSTIRQAITEAGNRQRGESLDPNA